MEDRWMLGFGVRLVFTADDICNLDPQVLVIWLAVREMILA